MIQAATTQPPAINRPSPPLDRLRNHGQPDHQGQPSRRLSDFRAGKRSS